MSLWELSSISMRKADGSILSCVSYKALANQHLGRHPKHLKDRTPFRLGPLTSTSKWLRSFKSHSKSSLISRIMRLSLVILTLTSTKIPSKVAKTLIAHYLWIQNWLKGMLSTRLMQRNNWRFYGLPKQPKFPNKCQLRRSHGLKRKRRKMKNTQMKLLFGPAVWMKRATRGSSHLRYLRCKTLLSSKTRIRLRTFPSLRELTWRTSWETWLKKRSSSSIEASTRTVLSGLARRDSRSCLKSSLSTIWGHGTR